MRMQGMELWDADDERRNRWYAAVGRYVAVFNRLEVATHVLAATLMGTPAPFGPTTDLQQGRLIELIDGLLRTADADGLFLDCGGDYRPDLVRDLRVVNADRNALVHTVHDRYGGLGTRVREIVRQAGMGPGEKQAQGAWPISRLQEAYDRLWSVYLDVLSMNQAVREQRPKRTQ